MFGAMLILSAATAAIAGATPEQLDAIRCRSRRSEVPLYAARSRFPVACGHFRGAEAASGRRRGNIEPITGGGSAWQYRHLVLGAVGIFLYVGAEVSIGSFLVNFMSQPDIAGFSEAEAAHYVSYFWGGAMIGRFIGAVVMRYVDDGKALAFNAIVDRHPAAGHRLHDRPCRHVVGARDRPVQLDHVPDDLQPGAVWPRQIYEPGLRHPLPCHRRRRVLPMIQGGLADTIGIHLAFLMPIICYVYIAFYGLKGHKPRPDVRKPLTAPASPRAAKAF
jgi:FHS family L-fucose permease-like MFS transporter